MRWQKSLLPVTRVQASATGHQKTHQAVARAAQSCDAAVALALPDDQKHAAAKAVTMPVPGASISIVGDTTTTFHWLFKTDKHLYVASTTSSISSFDNPASSGAESEVRAMLGHAPLPPIPPSVPRRHANSIAAILES